MDDEIKRKLGITYEKFNNLDFYEQQQLIEKYRKKQKFNIKDSRVMIGRGEHSIFVKIKRGEKYMLTDGTFVIAGDTPEKSKRILEDRIDDAIRSKSTSLTKKLTRKIKK